MEPAATERASRWDRVFELTSVVPLSVFVLVHTLDYGRVLGGVDEIGPRAHPSLPSLLLEAVLIWLPLFGHAVYGLAVWRRRRERAAANAPLLLHRLSGVVALAFLADHFVRFRLPVLTGRAYPADSVQRLAAELSSTQGGVPWVAALELLGVAAVAFHLSFGLRRIAERSERLRSSRAVRAACHAAGVVVGAVGSLALLRLATGG